MRVIFTRNVKPREGESFRKGDVVDLTGPSLDRWNRRGAIEPCTDPPVRTVEAVAPATVPEPPPKFKPRQTRKRKHKPSED